MYCPVQKFLKYFLLIRNNRGRFKIIVPNCLPLATTSSRIVSGQRRTFGVLQTLKVLIFIPWTMLSEKSNQSSCSPGMYCCSSWGYPQHYTSLSLYFQLQPERGRRHSQHWWGRWFSAVWQGRLQLTGISSGKSHQDIIGGEAVAITALWVQGRGWRTRAGSAWRKDVFSNTLEQPLGTCGEAVEETEMDSWH